MNVEKNMNNKQIKNSIEPFLQSDEEITEWDSISNGFLSYQTNPQILIGIIKNLKLKKSEEIISKLPDLFEEFMEVLAENYVLGNSSDAADKLVKEKNSLFVEKVNYYKTLTAVITKMERKRMIEEFKAEDAIPDESIENAFKRKGREEMNAKFKQWDEELEAEKAEKAEKEEEEEGDGKWKGKLISLFTNKIAIAASISLLIGFSLFKTFYTPNSFTTTVLTQSQMGFAGSKAKKTIKIVFNDDLKENIIEDQYTFFNNTLLIFDVKSEEDFYFIELESTHFYIKYNNTFYKIIETEIPTSLIKETDDKINEQLDKIIFNNSNNDD